MFTYWNSRTALGHRWIYFVLLYIVVHTKMCLFQNKNSLFISHYFPFASSIVYASFICVFSLVGCMSLFFFFKIRREFTHFTLFQEWPVPDFGERRVRTWWKIDWKEHRSDNPSTRFRRKGAGGLYILSALCAWLSQVTIATYVVMLVLVVITFALKFL